MIQRKRFEATLLLSVSNLGNPVFLRKQLNEPLDGQRFVDTVLKGMVTEDGHQLKVNRDRTEVVVDGDAEITKVEFHGVILPDSINPEHLTNLFGNDWKCADPDAATEKYDWIPKAIDEAERIGIEHARALWEQSGAASETRADTASGETGKAKRDEGPRESQRMLFDLPATPGNPAEKKRPEPVSCEPT